MPTLVAGLVGELRRPWFFFCSHVSWRHLHQTETEREQTGTVEIVQEQSGKANVADRESMETFLLGPWANGRCHRAQDIPVIQRYGLVTKYLSSKAATYLLCRLTSRASYLSATAAAGDLGGSCQTVQPFWSRPKPNSLHSAG